MTPTLTIDWERDRHPVEGAITAGTTAPHAFTGWLELLALLHTAFATGADEINPPTPQEEP